MLPLGGILVEQPPIVALHRYFLWADRMGEHFKQAIADFARTLGGEAVEGDWLKKVLDSTPPPTDTERFLAATMEVAMYMSYFYGALHVVIEGYRELRLSDPSVDAALGHPQYVDLLRRYRHGVFHFQKDYFDNRFAAFLAEGEKSAGWVRTLHRALSEFLVAEAKKVEAARGGAR